MNGEKYFVSWSGGKDSYLSLIKAWEAGKKVKTLVTFINKEGSSMSHGLPLPLLQRQARALELPLITKAVSWEEYEAGFSQVVQKLKGEGFGGGVFGDINIEAHREWVEKSCAREGFQPYLPLWGMDEDEVAAELLEKGAELLIVALRPDLVDRKWLGKILDKTFLDELKTNNISVCGEHGEYHTFAVNGPLFKEKVKPAFAGTREIDGHLFLDYQL